MFGVEIFRVISGSHTIDLVRGVCTGHVKGGYLCFLVHQMDARGVGHCIIMNLGGVAPTRIDLVTLTVCDLSVVDDFIVEVRTSCHGLGFERFIGGIPVFTFDHMGKVIEFDVHTFGADDRRIARGLQCKLCFFGRCERHPSTWITSAGAHHHQHEKNSPHLNTPRRVSHEFSLAIYLPQKKKNQKGHWAGHPVFFRGIAHGLQLLINRLNSLRCPIRWVRAGSWRRNARDTKH